jgi:hypothetical protein
MLLVLAVVVRRRRQHGNEKPKQMDDAEAKAGLHSEPQAAPKIEVTGMSDAMDKDNDIEANIEVNVKEGDDFMIEDKPAPVENTAELKVNGADDDLLLEDQPTAVPPTELDQTSQSPVVDASPKKPETVDDSLQIV